MDLVALMINNVYSWKKKISVYSILLYIYIYIKVQFLINQILNNKIKNNIQLEKWVEST
jgi:hypothetical protein